MARPNGLFLSLRLLEVADDEFADLMRHEHHREDVLQELALVEWAMQGTEPEEREEAARSSLAWLAYELGVRIEKPKSFRPVFPPPDELTPSTLIREIEMALEVERVAA